MTTLHVPAPHHAWTAPAGRVGYVTGERAHLVPIGDGATAICGHAPTSGWRKGPVYMTAPTCSGCWRAARTAD